MNGRGVAAVVVLGATAGAQLGTAFLTCAESGIPAAWKEKLRTAADNDTRVTRVFSGRPARGLAIEFIERLGTDEHAVPSYPVQRLVGQPSD